MTVHKRSHLAHLESEAEGRSVSPNVEWQSWNVPLEEREARNGHKAAVLWFTGLPGAGKTTIGRALERRLFDAGCQTMLLDGDQVRHGLNGDLGFEHRDREENIRRVGEAANLFFRQGAIVLCTFVSPYEQDRDRARALIPSGRFFEVFVDAPLHVVEERDPKGLYARARKGEISQMTGISSPYEVPADAEVHVHSDTESVEHAVEQLMGVLGVAGVVPTL